MLQGPVRDTVWAWCLADFETPNGVLNFRGVVSLGSLAGAKEYVRIASLTTSMTAGTDGSFTS
jgi:hypothetical protein